jgi:arsenite methyltransferase
LRRSDKNMEEEMEESIMLQENKQKADYGQDVPGLVRDKFLRGAILAVLGVFMRRWAKSRQNTTKRLISLLGLATLVISTFSALEGLALILGSRVGKMRIRDSLLDGLHLRGNETVLDVGCGHGVLLIGAAKRLPQGKAVGIDRWSQVDQGSNSRAATLNNAQVEGVADRVEVHYGDMCELPFTNDSFDAVIASVAIHNIESREGRQQAIREIVRVLKPGGKIALMDIFYINEYLETLQENGMQNVRVSGRNFWYYPPGRTVTASKR